jgi:hypothetical protein
VVASTKIILVGDDTPQNHSCGPNRTMKSFLRDSGTTTNTFLQRKRKETRNANEGKNEGNIFFLSLLDLEQEHKKPEQRRKELEC